MIKRKCCQWGTGNRVPHRKKGMLRGGLAAQQAITSTLTRELQQGSGAQQEAACWRRWESGSLGEGSRWTTKEHMNCCMGSQEVVFYLQGQERSMVSGELWGYFFIGVGQEWLMDGSGNEHSSKFAREGK